ncbi:hypothetical protein U9M48_005648 [Paspalum notatum var. saurae]|uniref:Uncharacterized protein n=1 Tax=Paspalum notatum var. saurae TaxID=547442 RepID=A0AAQ3PMU2_PASNO
MNLAYFRINYAADVALCLATALVAHPASLLALLTAWCLLYAPPLAAFGRPFSNREVLDGLVATSAFVVFLTSVGSLIFSELALGAAVVCATARAACPRTCSSTSLIRSTGTCLGQRTLASLSGAARAETTALPSPSPALNPTSPPPELAAGKPVPEQGQRQRGSALPLAVPSFHPHAFPSRARLHGSLSSAARSASPEAGSRIPVGGSSASPWPLLAGAAAGRRRLLSTPQASVAFAAACIPLCCYPGPIQACCGLDLVLKKQAKQPWTTSSSTVVLLPITAECTDGCVGLPRVPTPTRSSPAPPSWLSGRGCLPSHLREGTLGWAAGCGARPSVAHRRRTLLLIVLWGCAATSGFVAGLAPPELSRHTPLVALSAVLLAGLPRPLRWADLPPPAFATGHDTP